MLGLAVRLSVVCKLESFKASDSPKSSYPSRGSGIPAVYVPRSLRVYVLVWYIVLSLP